ncbi:MAG: hypothetical protein Kow0037_07820 [Calditrichia bacterium]
MLDIEARGLEQYGRLIESVKQMVKLCDHLAEKNLHLQKEIENLKERSASVESVEKIKALEAELHKLKEENKLLKEKERKIKTKVDRLTVKLEQLQI